MQPLNIRGNFFQAFVSGHIAVVIVIFIKLINVHNSSGARSREHIWLGDQPVAVTNAAGTLFYVLSDHQNTPRQIINANKQLRWRWDSTDPFGANATSNNPAGLGNFVYNLRFPGQYADTETGLFYNYFRVYDPKGGRYTQSDPIGLRGGLNTYTYVSGNPVNAVDPTGLIFVDPTGTIPDDTTSPGEVRDQASDPCGCLQKALGVDSYLL
jgi:RHS repeat-associated protein